MRSPPKTIQALQGLGGSSPSLQKCRDGYIAHSMQKSIAGYGCAQWAEMAIPVWPRIVRSGIHSRSITGFEKSSVRAANSGREESNACPMIEQWLKNGEQALCVWRNFLLLSRSR